MINQLASDIESLCHDFNELPCEDSVVWQKWDPARYTGHWQTPHLVIHNELNCQQPLAQGLVGLYTLQLQGVESKFLIFPNACRSRRNPESMLLWYHTVHDWTNRFLKSQYK